MSPHRPYDRERRDPMSRADAFWLWTFWLLAAGVLALSLMPTAAPLPTTGWDKSNHFVGFAALALAGRRACPRRGIALFAGLLAFGGMIEILQSFTAYRFGDWADWLADGVGITGGYALDRLRAVSRR